MNPHDFAALKTELTRHAIRVAREQVAKWRELERRIKAYDPIIPAFKSADKGIWVKQQIEARNRYLVDLANELGLPVEEALRRHGRADRWA